MLGVIVRDPQEFLEFLESAALFLFDKEKYFASQRKFETESFRKIVEKEDKDKLMNLAGIYHPYYLLYVFLDVNGKLRFSYSREMHLPTFVIGHINKKTANILSIAGFILLMLEDEITDIYADLGYQTEFEK